MKNPGVYKIINKANGRFYIGSTGNLQKRFSQHLAFLKKGIHVVPALQRDWDIAGEKAFQFIVLKVCKTKEQALQYEQKLLNKYFDFERICYNRTGRAIAGNTNTDFSKKGFKKICVPQYIKDELQHYSEITKRPIHEILEDTINIYKAHLMGADIHNVTSRIPVTDVLRVLLTHKDNSQPKS